MTKDVVTHLQRFLIQRRSRGCGHVFPRIDRDKLPCGGEANCPACAQDAAVHFHLEQAEAHILGALRA